MRSLALVEACSCLEAFDEAPLCLDCERLVMLRRIRRLIVNRLAWLLLLADGPQELEVFRASGDCLCGLCGDYYRYHVADPFEPSTTVLCDGIRVHL